MRTWLGMVGPGVRKEGRTDELFTDHTDIRPTILSLVNLKDDYAHDGRVVFEIIENEALPVALREHRETLSRMAEAYKQINAPTGKLGIKTLRRAQRRRRRLSATYDSRWFLCMIVGQLDRLDAWKPGIQTPLNFYFAAPKS